MVHINGIRQTAVKWETSGDITYLFYQAVRSDAADLKHGVIEKIDAATGSLGYAEGNLDFDKQWSLRATYSYSPLTA